MTTVIVSESGQVAIPQEILDTLQLAPGTKLEISLQGDQVVLHRVAPPRDWRTLEGIVSSGPSLTKALEEEHAAELALYDASCKGD